jgi:hypothetical protein
VVADAVDKLVAIEKQSAQRLRKHKSPEIPTVLIAMLFDAPDDGGGADNGRPGGSAHKSGRRAAGTRAAASRSSK